MIVYRDLCYFIQIAVTCLVVPISSAVVIDTTTCGSAKGCWSSSSGCTQSTCQWFVSYAVDSSGQNIEFELSGQVASSTNVYFAMSLSTTGSMGSFYTVVCYNNNGNWAVANGNIHIRGFNFSTNNLVNTSVSYNSGVVSCKFARNRQSTGFSDDLTGSNPTFFLLTATGSLSPGSPPTLQSHSYRWSSMYNPQYTSVGLNLAQYQIAVTGSTTQASATSQSVGGSTSPSTVSTAGCSTTAGCWLSTPGCTPSTCSYLLTWSPALTSQTVTMQLSAFVPTTSTPYVTMAFSNDVSMGSDYTIGCWWNGTAVVIQDGFTTGPPYYGQAFITPINQGVIYNGGWYNPSTGLLSCSFTRSLSPSGNYFAMNLAAGNFYYLFIAIGPTTIAGYGFTRHSSTYISANAVDVTTVSSTGSQGASVLVKVHACLMIFAWMAAFPIGSLVGRHYRLTLGLKSKVGDKIWFQLHRSLQIIGLLLTAAGFIVIFIEVDGYSDLVGSPDSAHPIIGIVAVALAVINLCFGIASPRGEARKSTKGRVLRWFHTIFGHSALILSFVNIVISFLMTSSSMQTPMWLIWLPVGFMAVHLVANITLHIHRERNRPPKAKAEEKYGNEVEAADDDGTAQPNNLELSSAAAGQSQAAATTSRQKSPRRRQSMLNNKFRKNLLYVYSAIVAAIAIALIVLVCVIV